MITGKLFREELNIPVSKSNGGVLWQKRSMDYVLKPNAVFYGEMIFYSFCYSAQSVHAKMAQSTGAMHSIFLSELEHALTSATLEDNKIKGWWTFTSKGAYYSLRFYGKGAPNEST